MKKNFNMVELIVVVVILAVFTTMLLPALSREESVAQKVKCAENLKQWGQNFALYAKDYDDYAGFFTGPRMSSTGYADPLVYHYNKLGYINDPSCTLWNTCPAATLPAPKAFAFLWSYDIFYNPTQSLEGTWEKGKTAQAVVKLSAPPLAKLKSSGYIMADGNPRVNGEPYAQTGQYEEWRHDDSCNAVFGDGHVADVTTPKGTVPADSERKLYR